MSVNKDMYGMKVIHYYPKNDGCETCPYCEATDADSDGESFTSTNYECRMPPEYRLRDKLCELQTVKGILKKMTNNNEEDIKTVLSDIYHEEAERQMREAIK